MTPEEIRAIPRPQTPEDYVACYTANVVEARDNLDRAKARWAIMRAQGQATPRVEGGWLFETDGAKKVYGEIVKWKGDLDHWFARKVQAEKEMRAGAVREVGADDDDARPAFIITEEEKAARVRELAEQLAMRMGEKAEDDVEF